jgi:hypothetical protein
MVFDPRELSWVSHGFPGPVCISIPSAVFPSPDISREEIELVIVIVIITAIQRAVSNKMNSKDS